MSTPNEQHRVVTGEVDSQSWPALLGRAMLDFTRVVEAEARLMRASVAPAITAVLDRWLLQLVFASIALTGVMLMLGAGILLLHKWVEWWASFAIVGGAALLTAGIGLLSRG